MLGNDATYAGTYAIKKRKKPVQKIKPRPENVKTNPSKRHRDRLNRELDKLTSLLPFSEDVCSRLDKLSVLRLSVAYIKVKNSFNATVKNNSPAFPAGNGLCTNGVDAVNLSEGDLLLQALNGFVLVVTSEGYVFYVSPTVQDYLGFHQSDVLHQSVFELIHTEDRAMFRRQLHFALNPQPFSQDQGGDDMQNSSDITRNIMTYDPQHIPPENSSFLERSFVCRMRCLLDNSSGFLALNFQGRLKYLHGPGLESGNGTSSQPQLSLFAVAKPVQPPTILEIRTKTLIFQTKHKLDFTPMAIDPRGKVVLGYTELELFTKGSGYQFIHAADMMHCADNHVRMMKTGESGLTVFRLLTKEETWVWVQANAKLIYKDGRPDFIISRQRVLLNEEGEEHVRQRKLQVPFNFASGEAVLYDNSPSIDVTEICGDGKAAKIRKVFEDNEVNPDSLLGSFYKQSRTAYMQPDSMSQFSLEKVFMETRALVNLPSNFWQREAPEADNATLATVLEAFGRMADDSDLGGALQRMDTGNSTQNDWENALLRLGKTKDDIGSSRSLDDILTNDILSYLEETLLKESSNCHLTQPQNCAGPDNGIQISKFPMGQSVNCGSSCVNGAETNLRSVQQAYGAVDRDIKDMQIDLPGNYSIPHLQDLQLDDIFPQSGELPELRDSIGLQLNGTATFSPWEKPSQVGISNGVGLHSPASTCNFAKPNGWSLSSQNHRTSSNCNFPPTPGQPHVGIPISSTEHSCDQSRHISLDSKRNVTIDQRNPSGKLSTPGTNFTTQQVNNRNTYGSNTHQNGCIPSHVSVPFQNPICLWPQNAPHNVRLNGLSAECQSQVPVQAERWVPNSQNCQTQNHLNLVNEKYHSEPPGGLSSGEHSSPSSCMFETRPPPSAGLSQPLHAGQAAAMSSPWKAVNQNQSPPQGSCYFQWLPSKPVIGTASIPQENACISPPACQDTPGLLASDMILQQYRNSSGQTQIQCHPTEDNESPPLPPLVNGTVYFSETDPTHCYNF
ncbi:aryl hydrocarbon receptor-like [Clupea harengus]|uniref:Aryl hydrocarbon receptor-like n=1 Tax=Clupea harengus TaxID=7950 RepID=A0A6P3VXF9_CLUHA|nr:aryl hydrocarbon receptor-like [Clupea harengus]